MLAKKLVSSVGRVLGRAKSSLFVLRGECQTAFFVEAGFPQQVFQLLAELADVGAGAAQFDGHVDVLAVTVFPAELVASAEVGEQLWAVLLQETLDALDSVPVFDIFYLLAGCVIGLLQDGEVTEHLRIVTVLFFAGVPGEIDENFPVGALGVVALLGLLQELAAVGHVGHEGHICAWVVVHYGTTEHHERVGLDLLLTFSMTQTVEVPVGIFLGGILVVDAHYLRTVDVPECLHGVFAHALCLGALGDTHQAQGGLLVGVLLHRQLLV